MALVGPEVLRDHRVEGPADEAGEVPEHRDVDNLRPGAQAADGEGVRELLLEALHGFLLVANVQLGGSYASRADRRTSTSAAKRLWFNKQLQRTRRGSNGASPLNCVFCGRRASVSADD